LINNPIQWTVSPAISQGVRASIDRVRRFGRPTSCRRIGDRTVCPGASVAPLSLPAPSSLGHDGTAVRKTSFRYHRIKNKTIVLLLQ